MEIEKYYDRVYSNFDRYLLIPVALIALSGLVLGYNYVSTGSFLQKGTDFTGGTEIRMEVGGSFSTTAVEKAFARNGRKVNAIRQTDANQTALIVQVPPPAIESDEAARIMEKAGYSVNIKGFRSISAAVSERFFRQAQLAFLMAFTIMSTVIFVAFRDVTPSLAVIFAAAGDILTAAAGMVILGIPLTLGSLAGLLMLIGYSVDTDIVLSTRVLKRTRGTLKSRIWSSMKTGVTMSSGGIAGFTILYAFSYLMVGPSELSNIAGVMVVGLLADLPYTWLGNAAILKKYVEGDFRVMEKINGKLEKVVPWS